MQIIIIHRSQLNAWFSIEQIEARALNQGYTVYKFKLYMHLDVYNIMDEIESAQNSTVEPHLLEHPGTKG